MPALDADIAVAQREAAIVTWASPTNAARYPTARDGSITPATGYCDSAADAQTIVDARGALIGADRRRFTVALSTLLLPAVSKRVPQARLVDAEQAVDAVHLVARLEVDLDAETTTLELFG